VRVAPIREREDCTCAGFQLAAVDEPGDRAQPADAMCHMRTKLLAQFAAQDMPTCSSSANLVKSCRYERLYVSHKAIAGGAWIDGIRFDHGSTTLPGVLHRCFDDLFGQPLSTQVPTNEEAGQRPYLFG
jgi:hypothetical protein